MDVFLIGFRPGTADRGGEFTERVTLRGAAMIRDWSSVTPDETRWSVVIDRPGADSIREAADAIGVEIMGTIRLVPDPAMPDHGEWSATLEEVLPSDPPPELGASITGDAGGGMDFLMALEHDLPVCSVCGWIGAHDPGVAHPNPS
jgi:hypothetical protein